MLCCDTVLVVKGACFLKVTFLVGMFVAEGLLSWMECFSPQECIALSKERQKTTVLDKQKWLWSLAVTTFTDKYRLHQPSFPQLLLHHHAGTAGGRVTQVVQGRTLLEMAIL